MIFLTVGTGVPFDRLVKAVDEAIEARVVTMPVFAQIGRTDLRPRNMEYVPVLEKSQFDQKVADAAFVISHAGIGSIMTALELRKRILVMPRMKRHGEVNSDHQVACARRFAELGQILAAYDNAELPMRLHEIESFVPVFRTVQVDRVALRVARFLEEIGVYGMQATGGRHG